MNTFILALALSLGSVAQADIVCPGLGTIIPNGDEAIITYAPETGFSDLNDTGSLVIVNATDTYYRTNKWGATLSIPNDLVYGKTTTGDVGVMERKSAPRAVSCHSN